jgi:hypothetical protein
VHRALVRTVAGDVWPGDAADDTADDTADNAADNAAIDAANDAAAGCGVVHAHYHPVAVPEG